MLRIALLVSLLLVAGSVRAEKTSEARHERSRHSTEVCVYLERCPSWEFLEPDEEELRKGITHLYLKLSKFDTGSVREGCERYLESTRPNPLQQIEAWGKLYAFYRVFFNIGAGFQHTVSAPERNLPEVQSFWGSPHRDGHGTDLLWPYSLTKEDTLALLPVQSIADRSGVGYDALADFDTLLARFGRRFPATTENPGSRSD